MARNSLPPTSSMVVGVRARRIALAVVAAIGVLGHGDPCAATTFVRMDAPQLARRSDAAVIASVTAVRDLALENGAAVTRVELMAEQVVFGSLPAGRLVLHEPGGRAGGAVEHVFGAPAYRPGERVLVFVRRTVGGTLRTTAMAMGKYEIDAGSRPTVTRDLAEATVLDPDSGLPLPVASLRESLADVLAALPAKPVRTAPPRAARLPARRVIAAPFTYLGEPSRWIEPDAGAPVRFLVDVAGDAALGAEATAAAVADALAAWSTVDGATLLLEDGALEAPAPFAGCGGHSRVVFNDPFDEIDAPVDCRGVLGIGGYCYAADQHQVGGRAYHRIRLGKVTIADGWADCRRWTPCNLAQIVTHELGHAIGLGHSDDATATMAGTASFDGRCAGLAADDIAGVRALYPAPDTPTPTPTATDLPSATMTATARATATAPAPTATVPPLGARGVRGRVVYYGSGLPVPGVEIHVRGGGALTALTEGDGDYGVDHLSAGDWLVEPRKRDTGAGAVSALDAALALQASAGLISLGDEQRAACDATGNGSVSPLDAARILEVAVGAHPRLPAAEACGSDFAFFPVAAPTANRQVIAPARDLTRCQAGGLRYAPLLGQVRGQDFRAALFGDCSGNWEPGDPRAAEPRLAPAGTALELLPLRRLPGGRWRLAVGLRSPVPATALDAELRYDAARLTPLRARAVHLGSAALIDTASALPGRLRIALASAAALPDDGRAVVVIDFAAAGGAVSQRAVRAFSAAVDDRIVSAVR